jgi:hypothetical protein
MSQPKEEAPQPPNEKANVRSGRISATSIKLSNLPDHVARTLAQFDTDGDGTLDWSEVLTGALGASCVL